MSSGLDPSFICQGLLFFGIRGRSFPAGGRAHRWVRFPSAYIVQGDAGAEVVPSGPQDPPITVEATPSGSEVPSGGLEVAASPTAVADPTAAIPSEAPSVVGVGARLALSRRQLRMVRRLFLGDRSSLASNLK
jgi:hypothetical protein